VVRVTITYTRDDHNNNRVSTDRCPLCGVPLQDNYGSGDHIYLTCPAAPAYRELGALKRGGPSPEKVEETIRQEIAPDPSVAADGGQLTCDRCGSGIDLENHRVYLQPSEGHEDLCLECQTRVSSDRLYRPASSQDGGSE
jgi:hypothetical protein